MIELLAPTQKVVESVCAEYTPEEVRAMAAEARAACAAAPAAKRDYARALDQARDTRAHLERTYAALLAEESRRGARFRASTRFWRKPPPRAGTKTPRKPCARRPSGARRWRRAGDRYAKTERVIIEGVSTHVFSTRVFFRLTDESNRTNERRTTTRRRRRTKICESTRVRDVTSSVISTHHNYGGLTSSLPWARPTRLVR